MKSESWLWTEADLLKLIELGVQESLELEYKRCDSLQKSDPKKNELSKDISAFSNSAGGTIVFGMKEDGHIPQSLDSGFDPSDITKEWLEQVINSRIQRRIDGVRVNQIFLNQTAPGRVAYVVFIPQSSRAPHQAWDKRFYKRFNFESVPMEEYEVRDVANRSSSPDLDIRFAFRPGGTEAQLYPGADSYFREIQLAAVVTNSSQTVAEHAVFHLYVDQRIQLGDLPRDIRRHDEPSILKMNGEDLVLTKLTALWGSKMGIPIFAGIEADVTAQPLSISLPCDVESLALRYTIGAPGMNTRDQYVFISVKDSVATFIMSKAVESDSKSAA